MHPDTRKYNEAQAPADQKICDLLAREIDRNMPEAENRIWHAHPVWFLDGNPIVGYSKLKNCVRLLFWSGQSFEETGLKNEGKFKAAEARYTAAEQINTENLKRWLAKARDVQWDYKNLVRRKGRLERLKQQFGYASHSRLAHFPKVKIESVRGAQTYVVLRVPGYDQVRVYDGSWAEWGNDPGTPVETRQADDYGATEQYRSLRSAGDPPRPQ